VERKYSTSPERKAPKASVDGKARAQKRENVDEEGQKEEEE